MMAMTRNHCWPMLLLLLLFQLIHRCHAEPANVYFINFSGVSLKMFWFDAQSKAEVFLFSVPPYQSVTTDTHTGHSFTYYREDDSNERSVVTINNDNEQHPVYLLGLPSSPSSSSSIHVQCSTTEGDIRAVVKPSWSPHGAARFLDLVRVGYYSGCALNRVVPGFLTQFGISADYGLRTRYRQDSNIPDDRPPSPKIAFQPGFLSYAGSGPDSRSAEVFVVMPDAPPHQLAYFGSSNPWETPFGYVEKEDLERVVAKWYPYGDMPPWGQGPNPQLIYQKGGYEEYLKKEFPKMSYIKTCQIVDSAIGVEEEL